MRSDIMKKGPERAPHRSLMRANWFEERRFQQTVYRSLQLIYQYCPRTLSSEGSRRIDLRRNPQSWRRSL